MLKHLLLFGVMWMFSGATLSAQKNITGQLVDAATTNPLPYATIVNPATGRGALTNDEGRFQLRLPTGTDSLAVSFIGYRTRRIRADHFTRYDTLRLTPTSYELTEATVFADDDILYEIVAKAGKRLKRGEDHKAKTYFQIVTNTGKGQPLEMIQAYYNATTNRRGLVDLKLKGGRIALAPLDELYFANLSIAQAIGMLDLGLDAGIFPGNPLQNGYRDLKRKFRLTRQADFSNETLLHLGFEPTNDNGKFFAGELWIDRETYLVHRIILRKDDVKQHPFVPEWKAKDIERIDLDLDFNFKPYDDAARLSHVNINYGSLLSHSMDSVGAGKQELKLKGILHCFNYRTKFFEPLFDYAPNHNDYRKISFLPYNSVLWETGQGLVLTTEQEAQEAYFYTDGERINFDDESSDGISLLQKRNYRWSAKQRYNWTDPEQLPSPGLTAIRGLTARPYPVIRLFLDVNPLGDSLTFISHTVLDVYRSAINMPKGSKTDCVLNVLLDLCEIKRREMMVAVRASGRSPAEITKIHARAEQDIVNLQRTYFNRLGPDLDYRVLSEYVERVNREMGIRNLQLFFDQ